MSASHHIINALKLREQELAVQNHNAYGWIRPDADACEICGRKAFNTPVDGFVVRECFHCGRLLGECCAEVDYGGGDDGSRLTSWVCAGNARSECERIAGEG